MGLSSISRNLLCLSLVTFGIAAPVSAAPKLRLDKTTIGPISISQGSNGSAQVVSALNGGDGNLKLTAASSASWLTASVQSQQSCGTFGAGCIPINLALSTASLAKGSYTGIVTLSDPNAIDAPQTITVTVLIGGGVPDSITLWAPASGKAVSQSFTTAKSVNTNVSSTNPSAASLSIAAPSAGSFATVFSYTLTAQATPGTADGAYTGSLTVTGSSVPAENKAVPITVNVTAKPIAVPSALSGFRIASGAAKQLQYIALNNISGGALTATAATPTGGSWLTTTIVSGYIGVTADPTGLSPGSYQGSVSIASNAANSPTVVPVQLDVLSAGPPLVLPGGVLNNATYERGAQLALGELPAVFGQQFTNGDVAQAQNLPLPTSLGGATVFINDQPVPIYYVSANQINFQIPYEAQVGDATLRVDRDGQRGNTVSISIATSQPKLLAAVGQSGQLASSPFGGPATPVTIGSYLTVYALGLGPTSPPVASGAGAPSSPLATVHGTNLMFFGTGGLFQSPASQAPQFIGLSPGFVGLYQINVQVPADAPRGPSVPFFLQGDAGVSNSLLLNIQ